MTRHNRRRLFPLALLASFTTAAAPLEAAAASTELKAAVAPRVVLRAGYKTVHTLVRPRTAVALKSLPKSATFVVNYTGFSPEAQAAFQHAVDIWGQLISSSVPIVVDASWVPLSPGILGGASAGLFWSGGSLGPLWYPNALADALVGSDLSPDADITAELNSNAPWYLGTDGQTPSNQYDLVTVALHELGHGLGFSGLMSVDGSGNGSSLLGGATAYASLTEDLNGESLVGPMYPDPSVALGDALQSGNVFFAGPLALNANGGQRPELFAPSQWVSGSSYSHLDEATYVEGNEHSLMTPFLAFAEAIHDPGAIALCLFEDLGWITSESCAAVGQTRLSDVAGLILPGFEVEVANSQGPTTLFAVRNTTDSALSLEVAYHGPSGVDTPVRTDSFELAAQETLATDIRFDLSELTVVDGFATGLAIVTEVGGTTAPNLEGDYFRLEVGSAFATADRLVRPGDFCNLQEARFADFGDGSQFRILINRPPAAGTPAWSYTVYDPAGNEITQDDYFTSTHLNVLEVADLGVAEPFGAVVFDLTNSSGGWIGAKYSAFGLFSVELKAACRD